MHPRTVAILIAAILLASFGVRYVVFRTGILPVSEEAVLKQATSLTVGYTILVKAKDGKETTARKSLNVAKPEDLDELFAVLEMRRAHFRNDWGAAGIKNGGMIVPGGPVPTVTFRFPDGTSRPMNFEAENWLGHLEVNRQFYLKVCDLVSRAEGRRVDLMRAGALRDGNLAPNDPQNWPEK